MSLHIVLGYPSRSPSAAPTLVYAGRSNSDARAAIEKSSHQFHQIFNNPPGLWKHNPRAAQPAVAAPAAEPKKPGIVSRILGRG